MDASPVFLDVKQFAERSGLPTAFVERLIREGKLVTISVGPPGARNNKRMIAATLLDSLPQILASDRGSMGAVTK